ncbi:MAG: hypothetical protein RIF41_29880 [Polyangiaceae bacterium]
MKRWAAMCLSLLATGGCGDDEASTTSAAGVGGMGVGGSAGGTGGEGGGGASGAGGEATGGTGGTGGEGGGGLADPAVFRSADPLAVCSPTPAESCTPSDLTFVASEYGSTFTRHDADGGTATAYRLVAFVEREGPSNIDVLVVDEQAQPLVDVPVAFYFSSAPDPSRPDEWYPNKVTGITGSNGIIGFALAPSAYLSRCGGGGPHAIWVSEPGATPNTTVPSDLADALGMLGGTNHRHLDLIFQRTAPESAPADAVTCPLQP